MLIDKTIRKYASFDEMKADEYRYWQSRPVHGGAGTSLGAARTCPGSPQCSTMITSQPRDLADVDEMQKAAESQQPKF